MTRTPLLFLTIGVQMATGLPASAQVTGPPVRAPIDVLRPQEQFAWLDSVPVGTPPAVWMNVPIELRAIHPSVTTYKVTCRAGGAVAYSTVAYGTVEFDVPASGDVSGRADVPLYLPANGSILDVYGQEYECTLSLHIAVSENVIASCIVRTPNPFRAECTSRGDRPRSLIGIGQDMQIIAVSGRLPDPLGGSPPGSTP